MRKAVLLMISMSLFPRLLAAQDFDLSALEGETWYGVYMSGQKSGYAVHSIERGDDGSVSVSEDARFRVSMEGVRQDMRTFSKRIYSAAGGLRSIEQRVETITGPSEFNAEVRDGKLHLRTVVGGAQTDYVIDAPRESLRDAFKQLELISGGGNVGDELTYSIFEPMYIKEISGVSRIIGVEERIFNGAPTRVFKIKTHLEVGIETVSYVAEDGTTLEDVVADMITTRLEPKEMAMDVDYSNDVIVSNAALLDKRIPDPRTRPFLRLRLTGPLTEAHLFNDERQYLSPKDDGVEFTAQMISFDGFKPVTVPVTDESVKKWIEPSLFIQSDNPRLIEKAREIVGDEKDAMKVSSQLCAWVYKNVRTTFTAQLSNALEVLDRLEGDCTEHSVLFIGLARAAGLPAREVAGLVYVDGARPGFYFHQWASVWVGKWIDVDPTFNQPLADVTHIKLAEGDLLQQARLIPIIGRIKVEVLDEPKSG